MDKDQIIQLRNHHLKQGRNNDRRPIYPITKAECIIGGAKQSMPKGTPEITGYYQISGSDMKGVSIALQPNIYYDLSDAIWFTDQDLETPDVGSLTFTFNGLGGTADTTNSYVFRIIIGVNSPNLKFNGVLIPDVTKKVLDNLEQGHKYEFNVFDRYMLVTDITATV